MRTWVRDLLHLAVGPVNVGRGAAGDLSQFGEVPSVLVGERPDPNRTLVP
jgi:hypothetical protein